MFLDAVSMNNVSCSVSFYYKRNRKLSTDANLFTHFLAKKGFELKNFIETSIVIIRRCFPLIGFISTLNASGIATNRMQ